MVAISFLLGTQAPFLDETAKFFEEEGRRLMEELDTAAYLLHCEVLFPHLLCGGYRRHCGTLYKISLASLAPEWYKVQTD